MPQVEAAACGVPLASVDYSAMSDIVNKTNGMPIKVQKMFYEWETNAYRAYPNNDHAAETFYKYLSSNEDYKRTAQNQARNAVLKHFDYDKTAKIWSDHFESIVLTGNQGQWNIGPTIMDDNIPEYSELQCSNAQYVEWLCSAVAKSPHLFFTHIGLEAIDQLNNGISSTFKNGMALDRKNIYEMFKTIGKNKILCDKARVNTDNIQMTDFVEFANIFEKSIK